MLLSGLNAWRKMVRSRVSRSAARRRLRKQRIAQVAAVESLETRVLLSAGALDPTFGGDGTVTTDIGVSNSDFALDVIAYQSDGKFITVGAPAGGAPGAETGPDFIVVRYNSDGSLDATFGTDGRVMIDFGRTYDWARGVAIDSQGRIVVAGVSYQGVTNSNDFAIARLTTAGALDTSFDSDGKQTIDLGGTDDIGRSVAVDSQDRIVVAGYSYRGGQTGLDFAAARLTVDGMLDASFDADGKQTIDFGGRDDGGYDVAIDSLDRVLISGGTNQSGTENGDFAVARLTTAGALDTGFNFDGRQTIDFGGGSESARSVAVDSQGRVLLVGQGWGDGWTAHDFGVVRLTSTGELDSSFDFDGKQTIDFGPFDRAWGVAVDSQDRVLVVGDVWLGGPTDFGVVRLTSTGALDVSFDSDGKRIIDFGGVLGDIGTAVTVDAQGRIVVVGYSNQGPATGWDFAVARLTGDGTLDASFDGDGKQTSDFEISVNEVAFDLVAYQSDGKLIVIGELNRAHAGAEMAVVRYNSDGTLDTTFGTDGTVTIGFGGEFNVQVEGAPGFGRSVAVDSQDRIVVAGYSYRGAETGYDFAVARLTSSGALDTSFDTDGKQTIDFGNTHDQAYGVAVDSHDRVLVSGQVLTGTGFDFAIARLSSAGTLDADFDSDGKQIIDFGSASDVGLRIAVDSLDRALVAGRTSASGSDNDFAVARLTSAGALDTDFDSDGKQTIDFGGTHDWGNGLAVDSQDRIVVGGYSQQGGAAGFDFAAARLTSGGALDTSFDSDGKQIVDFGSNSDFGLDVALDSRGRIVVAGYSDQGGTTRTDFAVVRLTSGGALDGGFDSDGRTTTDFGSTHDVAFGVAVDPQDRILVAGASYRGDANGNDFAVARYVTNQPPLADAGGPYSVSEGGGVTLNASATTDPDSGDTLTYAWDLDGDGLYAETGTAASQGDETGTSPIFSAAGLDGPTSVTVSLRVTDAGGLTSIDTATIEVTNVPPQNVAISGPTSGVRGQTLHFSGSFTDPGAADTHTQTWQVLDASNVVVASGSGATFSIILTEAGAYTISYTVADDDGGTGSDAESLSINIVEMQGNDLAVGGTTGNDQIVFEPGANAGEILVTINGVTYGPYTPSARLLAFGQAGDDHLQVAGSIELAAWLYGDAGHDRMKGGAGHDALFGGAGDDLLVGGGGRDLLVGGTGADRIVGNAEDDILIAGYTTFDYDDSTGLLKRDHEAAIAAILLEWASARDYATRIKNLTDGSGSTDRQNGSWFLAAGSTVIEDDAKDVLTGCEGYDWFFLDSNLDRVTDLDDEVFANDLDFINSL